jgi:hypothetical protein
MGLFEFIMVMLSIIVGLGIAELLNGVANVLQHRLTVTFYWVHALLVTVVFLVLVQQFWEAWGLRDVPEWTFGALLQMLGGPVCLYLCARLLFPDPVENSDLEDHYYGAMRPVWFLLVIANVAATTFRPLAFDQSLLAAHNLTSFILLAGLTIAWVSQNRTFHACAVCLALLLVLGDILLWAGVIVS